MSIRLGIAGCARGRGFLKGLQGAGFEVVAAMDPAEEALSRLSDEAGVGPECRYTHYEDLLAHGLDAVLLSSPMPNHAPQAILALEHGVHVLSEVPTAVSIDQCRRLRDAARASKAAYMMAENYTYRKPCQLVKAMARAGVFGELYYAEGQYLHDCRKMNVAADGSLTWRKRWQMDQRGVTYPTHSIGPVLQWMDDRVVSLSARGTGSHTDDRFEGDDTAAMLCRTSRGGVVEIRTDLRSNRPHAMTYYLLQGTEGAYEAARGFGDKDKIYLTDRHEKVEWHGLSELEEEFLPEMWRTHGAAAELAGHGGGDFLQMLDFAAACRGEPIAIDVYTALDWTLPGLVSTLSVAADGASLTVPDPRTAELDDAADDERREGRFDWFTESV